ncbi:MAG: VWA domain-containing protein [Bacteroidales bacterium]|nr:VWA domain-containing protein [Bacteroidales bacterium]
MSNYVQNDELANNPSVRVPICLCLDLSASMLTVEGGNFSATGKREFIDGQWYNIVDGGTTRLDELQKGLEMFFKSVKEDDQAVDSAEVAIVGFNSSTSVLLDFDHIENQAIPILTAEGSTSLGEGMNLALDMLEERKKLYKEKGIQYWQPWVVLMTDGGNNGSEQELERAINRTVDALGMRKLTIFPIGIGEKADMGLLSRFSPNRTPLRLKGLAFKDFFMWLSASISKVSVSEPGDKVELPSTSGWGTL